MVIVAYTNPKEKDVTVLCERQKSEKKMILPALMKVLKLTEKENDLCAGVA